MAFTGASGINSSLSNSLGVRNFEIPRNFRFQRLSLYGSDDHEEHIPPERLPQNLKEVIQLEHSYAICHSSDEYDDDDEEEEEEDEDSGRNIYGRDESKPLLFKKEFRRKSKFPFSLRTDPDSSEESVPLKTPTEHSLTTVQELSKTDNPAINELPNTKDKNEKLLSVKEIENKKDIYNDNLLSMYLSRIHAEEKKISFTKELKIVIKDCKDSLIKAEQNSIYTLSKVAEENSSEIPESKSKKCTPKLKIEASPQLSKLRKLRKDRKSRHSLHSDEEINELCHNRNPIDSKRESDSELKNLCETVLSKKNNSDNKKFRKRDKNSTEPKALKRRKVSSLSESSVSPELNCSISEHKLDEISSPTKKRHASMPPGALRPKEGFDNQNNDIYDTPRKKIGENSKNVKCQEKIFDLKSKSKNLNRMAKNALSPAKSTKSIEKITSPVEIPQNEKKRKYLISSEDSSSDCKIVTPEKLRESMDSKDSTVSSMILTKSHKKKVVKRDNPRFAINEDEPPLFSSPDMMIKVNTDDLRKETKENEVLDTQIDTIEEPKFVNHSMEKNTIELNDSEIKQTLDFETDKTLKLEEINSSSEPSIDIKNEENINEKNDFEIKEDNTKKDENLDEKSDFESKDDSKKEETLNVNNDFELKNYNIIEENLDEKTDFVSKDNKNDNHDETNDFDSKDLKITPSILKKELDNFEEKDLSDSHSDMPVNEADVSNNENKVPETIEIRGKDKTLETDDLNELKPNNTNSSETNAMEDEPKPERKSRRLIKKKEFFEFVSEPPSPKRKSSVQKQKAKSKESRRKSSSESEEEEEEDSSEDDPDKLWCICRKPHNNRFMIQCDTCEDWFHGTCVGVTKQQGYQLEKQKKDWICPNCRSNDDIPLSEKSSNKPCKEAKKAQIASEKKVVKVSKTEQKQDSKVNLFITAVEDVADQKLNAIQKKLQEEIEALSSKSKIDHKLSSSKSKSFQEKNPKKKLIISPALFSSGKNINLHKEKRTDNLNKEKTTDGNLNKEKRTDINLNKEKRTDINLNKEKRTDMNLNKEKRTEMNLNKEKRIDMNLNKEKRSEVNLSKDKRADINFNKEKRTDVNLNKEKRTDVNLDKEKRTDINLNKEKKADISNLKTRNKSTKIQTSTQSPVSEKKSLSKIKANKKVLTKKHQNCIQCQKPAAASNSCYCSSECIEKHAAECLKSMRETTSSSKDFNLQKLVVFDRFKGNVITGEKGPTVSEIVTWLKENPSFMIACSTSSPANMKKETSFKKGCDSSSNIEQKDSSSVNDLNKTNVRVNVKKTLKNILMERCKNSDDIKLPEEEVRKIAVKIEEELYAQFKDTNLKYRTKYRSLMFNIKDPRNQGLFRKILLGEIPPERVVHMSATELASVELSKWREQEMQHHLDMIKKVQLEHQKSGNTLHLKKTHKGEVEIEDDFTTIIEQDVLKSLPKNDTDDNVENNKEEQEAANDTTQLHRSHLFDLNCKICTGKVAPPPDESTPKRVRIAHSISVDYSSPNAVDPYEKSISRLVESKSPVSNSADDSLDQEPTSTVSIGSPVISDKESNCEPVFKPGVSVWKGFIFMQDIAKFVTSAYKVSGQTDRLQSDLPDTIQVCGRIIPDQVWDYLSKIKQSGNKELIIIQFQAANEEEAVTYNTFYSYLNCRKRYGVVSNYSKKIKDFYIIPLAATSPVPTVLMPFEGPGLPSPRPHLLLGVIVRHRVKQTNLPSTPKQSVPKVETETDGSYTPPIELRSYTPPLPSQISEDRSPEIEADLVYNSSVSLDVSLSENKSHIHSENKELNISPDLTFTALKKEITVEFSKETDDDKPYDPEQDVLSLTLKRQDENEKTQKNKEKSQVSENLEEHKKILDALTKQVEITDREVSALKHFVSSPKTKNTTSSPQSQTTQQVDINAVTETGMTTFLDLPINLQEILNTVRLKSTDKEGKSDTKSDVDMRKDNSTENKVSKHKTESLFKLQNSKIHSSDNLTIGDEKLNSLGATPPPPDDEKPTVAYPADPRIKLRTSYQDTLFNADQSASNYSQIPILDHMDSKKIALKEKESLKIQQEVKQSKDVPSVPGRLLPLNWNQFCEPPPPGIEPSEISSDIYSVKAIKSSDASILLPPPPPPPPQYTSSSHVLEAATSGFPPPAISFPTHLPPVFPVQPPPPPPPPPPSNIVQSSFPPPPLPIQNIPPERSANIMQDQWSTLQSSGYQQTERDWNDRASHWNDSYSSETSSDFHHEQGFSRERSSNKQWERHHYNRNHWHKHSHRGHKYDNRRGKRGYSYRKNHRN